VNCEAMRGVLQALRRAARRETRLEYAAQKEFIGLLLSAVGGGWRSLFHSFVSSFGHSRIARCPRHL
jgi:hypothetical protein